MGKQTVIENPVINSPFSEPKQYFKFDDDGITNEMVTGRRPSAYFIPVASPKKKGKQKTIDSEWTLDREKKNDFVNEVRQEILRWRTSGYPGITRTTRKLLEYWTDPERENKFFFCQIEALETIIFISEVAGKRAPWLINAVKEGNETGNSDLFRIAMKMATGTGKTVVMAMLISWQVLNKKLEKPTEAKDFSDNFLIVTPGLTIRDRLRVLYPNDSDNYYAKRDVVPSNWMPYLGQAQIVITNFHSFKPRQKIEVSKITKAVLNKVGTEGFVETAEQMVSRVCRPFGSNKKNIIVINDEAHHCYRHKADEEEIEEELKGEERTAAERREEDARVWLSGLEAIKKKLGIRAVYDLSATPFFLKGSGWSEGTLFPWVVSDFSLIDAIEAGIVKVPRVPIADNSMSGEQPTFRDLWYRIRESLPKKGRKVDDIKGVPRLPKELESAVHSLYSNYLKYYDAWKNEQVSTKGTPPVFIVVCNNTSVSKLVYDYIAGYSVVVNEEEIVRAGELELFRNDDGNGHWLSRPNTILVDSEQLESGEGMSDDFKKIASREIEEFKNEYRARFPGRDVENLNDDDLLREVMNTVGKEGKLGEQVKCVISVSMLTEGWDAQTVTHVLGVRAFGTQLLCEQVIGRALRRTHYVADANGMFPAEYAEVYGVPFSFIPTSGSGGGHIVPEGVTHVQALPEREECEIHFPRVIGYRTEMPGERVEAHFTSDSKLVLSTRDVPTKTENAPIVGSHVFHTMEDIESKRVNEVAFILAKTTLERYFRDQENPEVEDGGKKEWFWLFPQILEITKQWMNDYVVCKDDTFIQMLLLKDHLFDAAERIYRSLSLKQGEENDRKIRPIIQSFDSVGSTKEVNFDTRKDTYRTLPEKCHVSHVVADTTSWEQKAAQSLESMDEVIKYVKNDHLGFEIPYSFLGRERKYLPDFIVATDDGHGRSDPLNLILEITGEKKPEKEDKSFTARNLWVPSVNNTRTYGRWDFIEITDPWNLKANVREFISSRKGAS
ncbi:MAG: DEAD/DEAH box helicase family protein [Methanomassiliicoccales archaeon]